MGYWGVGMLDSDHAMDATWELSSAARKAQLEVLRKHLDKAKGVEFGGDYQRQEISA